ncbi:Uncharacterised protein [Bordetella pertussis]|nr:Uncharacterised protein [Bordetella pertussis]
MVVSQHCSVRMPQTMISPTPCSSSQSCRVWPASSRAYRDEWTVLRNTAVGAMRSSRRATTCPEAGANGEAGSLAALTWNTCSTGISRCRQPSISAWTCARNAGSSLSSQNGR